MDWKIIRQLDKQINENVKKAKEEYKNDDIMMAEIIVVASWNTQPVEKLERWRYVLDKLIEKKKLVSMMINTNNVENINK